MPMVVVTGYPSSGKSTTTARLKEYLKEERGKEVDVISEDGFAGEKDMTYADAAREKLVRSQLKGEAVRMLSKDRVTIVDGLNYIKGFR